MQPAAAVVHTPFAEIFREHAPRVFRALRRLGVAEADVPDLCQEVFVVLHRKLPEFEGRSSLGTYVYGIAERVASDHRRRAHVRRERATGEVPEERTSAPQIEDIAREQARTMLDTALATLDDDKRAVFVLYEIEQLAMPAVAEALSCPLQTAYSRLHAARKQVAAEIVRLGGGRP